MSEWTTGDAIQSCVRVSGIEDVTQALIVKLFAARANSSCRRRSEVAARGKRDEDWCWKGSHIRRGQQRLLKPAPQMEVRKCDRNGRIHTAESVCKVIKSSLLLQCVCQG